MVVSQATVLAIGVASINLAANNIAEVVISIPEMDEQEKIVDYLDKQCNLIDVSVKGKETLVKKLRNYKNSLIYEVVTGKKEI